MHCEFVCRSHELDAAGAHVFPEAHASCSIHTLLTLLSGAWVPWRDAAARPSSQQRARRIVTAADSPEGRFVSEQLEKGLALDLWEKLTPEQAAAFEQCSIIEAGFAALVGKLRLSDTEIARGVNDAAETIAVPDINAIALERATAFVSALPRTP